MGVSIFRIAAIGICTAFLALALRKESPVFASLIGLAGSVLIFLMVVPHFAAVFDMIQTISGHIGEGGVYVATVLRVVGIAYAAEFGASTCADAGESGLASKVELAGKVLILAVSAPVVLTLLRQILNVF